jgi:hypothetical protein
MNPHRLRPWIQNKSGKYYTHAVVAGTVQLAKLSSSFALTLKYMYTSAE